MNLYLGDCLIELKKLPDKSIDFFYLDLPYGQTACSWDKKIDLKALWIELKRLAKNDRTPFFFSCTTKFGFELYNNSPNGWFRWDLVWKKNRAAGFLNAYKLPMRKHEMIYCFAKKTPEYDVSSHLTGEEIEKPPSINDKFFREARGEYNSFWKVHKSKVLKEPLPTSDITQPEEEHEMVYCFAKKTPAYDVSSHQGKKIVEYTPQKERPKGNHYNLNDKSKEKIKKTHIDRLPTSDITPICDTKGSADIYNVNKTGKRNQSVKDQDRLPTSDITPSSWCEFNQDEKINHRTNKPIKLMEFLLKYWTKEGDVVCDPTMGSGSMGVACKNMNRKFIGIEIDEVIYKLAQSRLM